MKRHIAKLVSDGLYKEALCFHSHLHSSFVNLSPNKFTFPPLLKACGKLKALQEGQMLHTYLVKTGFHAETYASTALMSMYMNLQLLDDALKAFNEIPDPNIIVFNAAISGFSQNENRKEAFEVFKLVHVQHLRPDSVTIASLLSGCEDAEHGLQIHCWAIKIGVEMDIYVATSLVTMYSNCGECVSSMKVFEQVQHKNDVCYNAFITGLLQNGFPQVVLDVFKDIKEFSIEECNPITLTSVISACSDLKNLQFGIQLHGYLVNIGMVSNTMIGTALVDMYSKCFCWQFAYTIFKEMSGSRNIVTWNSMIAGMMLNNQCETAAELFFQLQCEGLKPDSATWNTLISGFSQLGRQVEAFFLFRKMLSAQVVPTLKSITSLILACSALSILPCGREVHGHVVRAYVNKDKYITTALIDMYMKCGRPSWAQQVFYQFEVKPNDPAIWNVMISGYGINGDHELAFEMFEKMLKEKVQPNMATFSCILTVCSHAGQVDKGCQIFKMITKQYDQNPTTQHYNIMIDLLSRAGQLDKVRELLQECSEPSSSKYASALGACKFYSNPKLAEEMAKKLSELEPENPFPFVILSGVYAELERWKDVESVRDEINGRGMKKYPGFSLIGVT